MSYYVPAKDIIRLAIDKDKTPWKTAASNYGICYNTLRTWVHGYNEPTYRMLSEICEMLGYNLVDLIHELQENNPYGDIGIDHWLNTTRELEKDYLSNPSIYFQYPPLPRSKIVYAIINVENGKFMVVEMLEGKIINALSKSLKTEVYAARRVADVYEQKHEKELEG